MKATPNKILVLEVTAACLACIAHETRPKDRANRPSDSPYMVMMVGDHQLELDKPAMAFPKGSGQMEGWMGYALARRTWIDVKFRQRFPQEARYKYTFDEELYARGSAADMWTELNAKKRLSDRYFNELGQVHRAGFMREYVWFCVPHPSWSTPTGLRADAFSEWMSSHLPEHQVETRVAVVHSPKFEHVIIGSDAHQAQKCGL